VHAFVLQRLLLAPLEGLGACGMIADLLLACSLLSRGCQCVVLWSYSATRASALQGCTLHRTLLWLFMRRIVAFVCRTSHRTLRSVARGAVSRAAVVAYVVLSAPFLVPSQWGAPGCLTWDSFELDGLP
jgi:hypothetical protein